MKVSMTDEELKVAQEVLATRETTVATRELKAHAAEVASQRAALEFGQKLLDQKLFAWQKLIDMATHFNELCLNVRRFALATLATLLAASGIAYRFAGHISFEHPDIAGMVLPWSFLPFLVPLALVAVVRGHPSTDQSPQVKPIRQ